MAVTARAVVGHDVGPETVAFGHDPEVDGPGMKNEMLVFSGSANTALAREIASHLGMRLGNALVSTFKNEETRVRIEENVRGVDVFVVQSTCSPVDHNIMELLLMIDALRRALCQATSRSSPSTRKAKL